MPAVAYGWAHARRHKHTHTRPRRAVLQIPRFNTAWVSCSGFMRRALARFRSRGRAVRVRVEAARLAPLLTTVSKDSLQNPRPGLFTGCDANKARRSCTSALLPPPSTRPNRAKPTPSDTFGRVCLGAGNCLHNTLCAETATATQEVKENERWGSSIGYSISYKCEA